MGIIARYDGRLYAQIKDRDGKWIKRSLDTKDKAVARARYKELERTEADPLYRTANETPLSVAILDFLASRSRKGCVADTVAFYETKTAHLARVLGEELRLSRLDAAAVDRYIDVRLGEHASRNTIGKELGALRGLLKVARRAGKFLTGVDTVMPAEWSNDYQPRERALTSEEVRRLVAELACVNVKPQGGGKERNSVNQAACVAFMVATGARIGEARRAERSHVSLERGLVFLAVTKTKRRGRGDRFVPITPLTRPLLEQVMAATAGRKALFDPWVNVQRDIADACVRAGITRCSPNDLRRTHGTWLRNAGVEPQLIGAALGHKDSRMVERVYGRLEPAALLALLLERVGAGTLKGQGNEKRRGATGGSSSRRASKTP